MDKDTENGRFFSIRVCLWYDKTELDIDNRFDATYDLTKFLLQYDRVKLFKTLKEVVEREEGYKAELNLEDTVWDEKAITLNVVIE